MNTYFIDRKGREFYHLLMAQESQTSGEELLDQLDSLRKEMNRLIDKLNASGIERTNGLRQIMGRDCDYYKKSLNLFLQKDYISVRNLVSACHELFNKVEGHKTNE
jgi:hypothetical protein